MEFDYIVIGSGSSGAIIARRLADADIGTVGLIEAGKLDENNPSMMDISRLYEQTAETDWGFMASTLDRSPFHLNYSRAKILGGCGNHNDCAYLVPPGSDFDSWERLGASGWGRDGVRPYFHRLEERVQIETRPSTHPISAAFLKAGQELGLDEVAFRQRIGPGVGMLSLNAIGRFRQSSSVVYLHPLRALPHNLHIIPETMATRLIVRDGEAVGCETTRGDIFARAEMIVAAGSIQSPQLLMASGIGEPTQLQDFGIAPVATLPGVGRNLTDHFSASTVIELGQPVPPWEITPYEAVMLLRIDDDAPAPDSLCHFGLKPANANGRHGEASGTDPASGQNRVDIAPNAARPRSRGEIRLASADMRHAPVIRLNYFSDPDGYDLRIVREALRFARRFAGTPTFRRLAAREVSPGPDVVTDDEIAHYIRSTCETVYHASGTCRMGRPDDPACVVTPDLRVRGVGRLRVCDASVFPTMVTVNINSTVMMIAEKASDLIIADARDQLRRPPVAPEGASSLTSTPAVSAP